MTPAQLAQEYERDRLGFLLAVADQYGPVVELARGTVVVTDAAAIFDIFRRTNTDFLIAQNFARLPTDGRHGESDLDSWMVSRRTTLAATTPDVLAAHCAWLRGRVRELCDEWRRRGTVTTITDDLTRLTSQSFARFCFGSRPADAVPRAVDELVAALVPVVSSPIQLPAWLRVSGRHRRLKNAERRLSALFTAVGQQAGSGGLIDVLRDVGFTEPEVLRMLVSTSIAAHRVPACAIAWTLAALADQPTTADELATDPGRTAPVVAEGLRLWPPTWLIHRTTTTQDQEVAGWLIPADSAVMISPYVVHRQSRYFDSPEEFRPERWRGPEPPRGAYIPYGAGPRWCLGARFADAEVTTVVATVTEQLRLDRINPIRPDATSTLAPAGLAFAVARR